MAAGDDVAAIGARRRFAQHFPIFDARKRDIGRRIAFENRCGIVSGSEIGVGDVARIGRIDHFGVADSKRFGFDIPPFGGQIEEQLPRGAAP